MTFQFFLLFCVCAFYSVVVTERDRNKWLKHKSQGWMFPEVDGIMK